MPRNTPTCVGKTLTQQEDAPCCEKHPHVRGEDAARCPTCAESSETPPRAWGRQIMWSDALTGFRNTPTCVGKTAFSS